jgi:hypothetical protein
MNLVATGLAAGDVPSWVSIHDSQQKISQLQRPMLSDKPRNPCNWPSLTIMSGVRGSFFDCHLRRVEALLYPPPAVFSGR